jgi:hypothetical protein
MSEPVPDYSFYRHVINSLELIEAPYMLIGGFVAAALGSTRTTFDIDIVVDLDDGHIDRLVERYPLPRYYADPHHMRECIRKDIMFNIIDTEQGQKADLVPVGMNPRYRQALARRVRLSFEDIDGSHFEAWAARPEDVIIGKLLAWNEGRSFRHELDIRSMLLFVYAGLDPDFPAAFDEVTIDQAAAQIGPAVAHLWDTLKAAAELELKARRRR